MKNGIVIRKLKVTGETSTPAVITFDDGFNLVSGPSNTGKSWIVDCINYALCASNTVLDDPRYDTVELTIENGEHSLTITRNFFKNKGKAYVTSTIPGFVSDTYYCNKKDKEKDNTTVDEIILDFMGIDHKMEIPKNSDFVRQRLTYRTFSHLLVTDQTYLQTRKPILLPDGGFGATAAKSALLFLLQGDDYSIGDAQLTLEEKKTRQKALVEFIEVELSDMDTNKQNL